MHLDIYSIIFLLSAGFGSGLFVSICSGTAAGYMIPILTILGSSIHKSIGTSLFVDSLVGLSAGLIFLKKGKTKVRSVLPVIFFSAIGAFIGSFFTSYAPERGLNIYILIVLFVFGINLMYNGYTKNIDFIKSKYSFTFFKKYKTYIFVILGFSLGFSSGLTGFGGAGLLALGFIFVFDYDLHTSIGTSLIIMFFLAGFGAIGHVALNEFIWEAGLIAGLAAVIGASVGSLFANKINEDILARVIGLIMLVLGFIFLYQIVLS